MFFFLCLLVLDFKLFNKFILLGMFDGAHRFLETLKTCDCEVAVLEALEALEIDINSQTSVVACLFTCIVYPITAIT